MLQIFMALEDSKVITALIASYKNKLNSSLRVTDDNRLRTVDILVVVLILMPYRCILPNLS